MNIIIGDRYSLKSGGDVRVVHKDWISNPYVLGSIERVHFYVCKDKAKELITKWECDFLKMLKDNA